jgi:MraZ protein
MAVFLGELETTIDAKHRLAIGSAFREQIDTEADGESFVLILGPDRHLWLYPDRYYRRLIGSLKRSPLPRRETANFNLFFGMARVLRPDAQGRVVLPPKPMSRAKIAKQVTLVANGDHLEIWPTEDWEAHVEAAMPTYGEMLYEAADRLNEEQSSEDQP